MIRRRRSVTVFGASGSSTPATGGTVVVSPGGIRLTGTVDFNATGDNSIYTIRGGNLTVAAGGTSFNVDNVAVSGTSAVIASRIVGTDGISVFGPGGLLLTGANSYAGGTFICSCASLQLGDATHTASIVGTIVNDGLFSIVNANTAGITSITNNGIGGEVDFSNTTSAGTAHISNNGGAIFFFDHSNAGNANITNQFGVTFFGTPGGTDMSTAGNATINNNNGGTIFAAMTNAGTAHITNVNGGGTEFFESASAASATIVNNSGGFTSFGSFGPDAPTAGHAMITNNSGGETDFNTFSTAGNAIITTNSGGATYFYDGSTGGNAQFITNGTGFVDFSGSLGPGFDGRITAGSIAGSGTYYIGAFNTLIVGSNNLSTTVSGVIADFNPSPPCGCPVFPGPGSLEKVGTGMLTLSGINTYTGTTTVSGGVLDVEGSIASSFLTTVNAGGALSGAGIVGNTVIAPGGIFVPGNGLPGSSMTVAGNLAFQSGALYLVTLNSTASTFAKVTGTATLAGTVGAAFLPGSEVIEAIHDP